MAEVKVQYAKTHLSALLARVEAGEDVVISRGDTPIARLVPIARRTREFGFLDVTLPDDFFDPLPEEDLAHWEGSDSDPLLS